MKEQHTSVPNRWNRDAVIDLERTFEKYEEPPERTLEATLSTKFDRSKARTLPEVPENPKYELAWLEWMGLSGDAVHPFYHRAGLDAPYDPWPGLDNVLTTRARADDLAQRPCPTCYPGDERNDDLDLTYYRDEKDGLHQRVASKDPDCNEAEGDQSE